MGTASKLRVLIVDDSSTIRRLLTDQINADPELEVSATADGGARALAICRSDPPDIITLDVEMPGQSGIELLPGLRALCPQVPVIMYSSLTARAAASTLDALSRGAVDYVCKPSGLGREQAEAHVRTNLLPKLKELGRSTVLTIPRPASSPSTAPQGPLGAAPTSSRALTGARAAAPASGLTAPPVTSTARPAMAGVLVIGATTGGPTALEALLHQLGYAAVPVVICQPMPGIFTALLSERLALATGRHVAVAQDQEPLRPDHVYFAPSDRHLRIVRGPGGLRAALDGGPAIHGNRPSLDALFTSAAAACGSTATAIVLSGIGEDGIAGSAALRSAGGHVLVQDRATSTAWALPGAVVAAGSASQVIALDRIVATLGPGRGVHPPD